MMNMQMGITTESRLSEVEVAGLSKSFGPRKAPVKVLDELSLQVQKGEMLVLLGPSGCGKTTLLRCIVGLEQPDEGLIRIGAKTVVDCNRGVVMAPDKRDLGMVFQNYALWPHMTVAQNVAFPLKARGQHQALAEGRVKEALEIVQCAHLADRYPSQLSGGQQQRVALARALGSRPEVLLMDEPLSNLDALLRVDLRAQLHQLHRRFGFTGIYVTHDQSEAISLGSRVVVMRSGRMEQIGRPIDIYDRPANEYVAGFLGMRNRLSCSVDDAGQLITAAGQAALPSNLIQPGRYQLRSRPTELALRASGDTAARVGHSGPLVWVSGARVVSAMHYGDIEEYGLQIGEETVLVERKASAPLDLGASVDLGIDIAAVRFYTPDEALADSRRV